MRRPRIRCVDCGHGASRHYDPIRDSDRNVTCKKVNRIWMDPSEGKRCRCMLTRREVEIGKSWQDGRR